MGLSPFVVRVRAGAEATTSPRLACIICEDDISYIDLFGVNVNIPYIKLGDGMEDRDLTSEHVRAARALLRWEQKRLAEESGISLPTIGRLEMQPGVLSAYADTTSAIKAALERAGIVFLNDGSPGVQLKKKRVRIVADSGNPKGHITDPEEADRID
jgi:hypothetical protein